MYLLVSSALFSILLSSHGSCYFLTSSSSRVSNYIIFLAFLLLIVCSFSLSCFNLLFFQTADYHSHVKKKVYIFVKPVSLHLAFTKLNCFPIRSSYSRFNLSVTFTCLAWIFFINNCATYSLTCITGSSKSFTATYIQGFILTAKCTAQRQTNSEKKSLTESIRKAKRKLVESPLRSPY